MLILAATLAGILLGLVVLPLALRVRVDADGQGPWTLRLDGGLWRGLGGLSLCRRQRGWSLRLLVGRWPLGWPAWNLRRRGAAASGAVPGAQPPGAAPGPDRGAPRAKAAPRRAGRRARQGALARARRLRQPLLALLRGTPGWVSLHAGRVQGTLGLGDPARTGLAYGMQQALRPLLHRRVRIDLEPCFTAAGFRGRAELVVHVHLHRILWTLVRAAARWPFAGAHAPRPADRR